MALAQRLERLGTETAFAVAQAAADWKARGNRVYPFHLGDLDLPMPGHVVEAMNQAIRDGHTGYCPGAGIPPLREALADDIGSQRGLSIDPGQVIVQPGGKPVISKFLLTVMDPGDEVLYPNPGFPIYESQIEFHGGVATPYRYLPTEDGFWIDLEQIRSLITPRTKAIVYNDLQNPISAESTPEEQQAVAQLAQEHDLWVLSDEAYFEMRYEGTSRSIAALDGMAQRTVILYTFSKKFAMTGSRLGCAVTPPELAGHFSTLNTNEESCTTHYVQYAGVAALRGDQTPVRHTLDVLRERRDAAAELVNATPGMSVALPRSTFYLFPDVTEAMQRVAAPDLATFAEQALHATGVSFCTRLHFGRPQPGEDRAYARFAYSGLPVEDIREGLGALRDWVAAA